MDAASRRAHALVIDEVVSRLSQLLTRTLTAYMAGVDNNEQVRHWISGLQFPTPEQEERLRAAYQLVTFLRDYEADDTIRAFFIGMNPVLNDRTVVEAIHDGKFADSRAAALHLVTN